MQGPRGGQPLPRWLLFRTLRPICPPDCSPPPWRGCPLGCGLSPAARDAGAEQAYGGLPRPLCLELSVAQGFQSPSKGILEARRAGHPRAGSDASRESWEGSEGVSRIGGDAGFTQTRKGSTCLRSRGSAVLAHLRLTGHGHRPLPPCPASLTTPPLGGGRVPGSHRGLTLLASCRMTWSRRDPDHP